MGSVRPSSRDPRCYHPQLSPCPSLPWRRVAEAAVLCSIATVVRWLRGLWRWWAETAISYSSRYVCLWCPCYRDFGGKREWTDGLIMPSATLTGLSEPLASSNNALALPPHKWVFCFSDISTDFPVANSQPLACHLPCAHPNAQRPELGTPLSCYVTAFENWILQFAFWYLNCKTIKEIKGKS